MNMNQLINMLTRMFAKKATNWAVRKGTSQFDRSGVADDPGVRPTKAQQDQKKRANQAAKRAQQALRITRRLGR